MVVDIVTDSLVDSLVASCGLTTGVDVLRGR